MFVSVSLEDCEYVCDMFVVRTELEKGVASGTKTGQICIWDLYRKRNSGEFVVSKYLFCTVSLFLSRSYVLDYLYLDHMVLLCQWHLSVTGQVIETVLLVCVIKGKWIDKI